MAMVQNGTDAKAKPYHKINFMKFNIHLHAPSPLPDPRRWGPGIRKVVPALVLLATLAMFELARPSIVSAQGTAFTYQGRLNDSSNAASGNYDLQFKIYDAATAGNVVGSPLTNAPTGATNGLFTVTLDFGSGVFTGPARWLEIGVRTNGSAAAYSTLTPRQALTASPYAVFAGTSANVGSNSVVTSLNALKDNVTLAAGSNVTITPSGNTLTVAAAGAGGSGIWSVLNNNAYYTAGGVGVGTSTPKGALQIASGGVAVTGASSPYTGAGAGVFMESASFGGALFAFDYSAYLPRPLLLNSPGGNVGIGTIYPLAQLHVYDPANSVADIIETGGGVNAWAKTMFKNLNGQWDIGTSRGFNGDEFYIDRVGTAPIELQLTPNGNLGLGIQPIAKLHLYDPASSVSHRIETGGGANAWTRIEFANGNGQWDLGTSRSYNGDQLYIAREGGANPAFAVQPTGDAFVAGNLSVCSLTIRGGCDLAEPFPMKEEVIEKGSVVVIDDEHPGELKLSTRAYDARVAGIVSGANGIHPGINLQQEGAMDGGQDVALTGRVYVLAEATHGAIRPGDLLTTSDLPGRAMKVTDHVRAQGAILGKAMSGLSKGTGVVLVLVTLQ